MNGQDGPHVTEYRCAGCDYLYYGPAGVGMIGVSYLGQLYAFQSAALGCPRCGSAIRPTPRTPGGAVEARG